MSEKSVPLRDYHAKKKRLVRRLRREKILLQLIRKQTKTIRFRLSTIKVFKPVITPWEGLAILIGTQVGAGILGLPYVASKVGIVPALLILVGVMFLLMFTALTILKLSAEMGGAQMSTMAQKILGNGGGWIMYLSILIMGFGAMLAYIAGMGSVFSSLLGVDETLGAVIFWLLASAVIYLGLEASGKTELVMSFLMLILFIGITASLFPHAKPENAMYVELGGTLSMTGVAIFSLGCHTIIPDVYRGIGDYKKARNVVILAFLIPTVIYAIFMVSFLLVFGKNTPQIATQGLENLYGGIGKIVGNIIPLLAITTSYIGIGLAQQSNSKEFLKLKKSIAWSLTTVPPIAVYLAGIKNFADVLAFAGDTGDMVAFILLPLVMLAIKRYRERR
ncbi:MAG TPA: amino acid permease [Thermoplasmatales archaeon]|nr:amino acid permease [Thermoplasmatales archaeon]